MFLLLVLVACDLTPSPVIDEACADGFVLADDGNCYAFDENTTRDDGSGADPGPGQIRLVALHTGLPCAGTGNDTGPDTDVDEDGYDAVAHGGDDCDDTDAAVHPGAAEVCDDIDNDCDGLADTDAVNPTDWYDDLDGDGYGNDTTRTTSCEPSRSSVTVSGDCDDVDADVHPGAAETWYDDVDQDCDGTSDWDADGDGYPFGIDCDDTDPAHNPVAIDLYGDGDDMDCDGDDGSLDDRDGDDHDGDANDDEDCDDTDASIHPDAEDVYGDGIDTDCDGMDA